MRQKSRTSTDTPLDSSKNSVSASLSAGELVAGRYRIVRLLGVGGMGEVYEAEDLELNSRIAVKRMRPDLAENAAAITRFRQEILLARRVTHRNICRIFDIFEHSGSIFCTMELLPGETLSSRLIREGRLSIADAFPIISEIAVGLEAAHREGIVHGDLKSSNVMLLHSKIGDGRVVIMDFGLAQQAHSAEIRSQLTQEEGVSPAVAGTLGYAAPEQLIGGPVTPATDIYSFGVVIYQMVTGRLPFKADFLQRSSAQPLIRPSSILPDFDPGWDAVILRCLERKPARRFQNAAAVMKALAKGKVNMPTRRASKNAHNLDSKFKENKFTENLDELPTRLFDASVFSRASFFQGDGIQFDRIEETVRFYRDHLNDEYQILSKQARFTFLLWSVCVIAGFSVVLGGIILLLYGSISRGLATCAASVLVYFIQRIFQQREDHYRAMARMKHEHLEYGDQWLLVIQSIDSIQDLGERAQKQARLVDVLTKKLARAKLNLSPSGVHSKP
jgi:serine/threonine protein kinase